MAIIEGKNDSAYYLPWFAWDFMENNFVFGWLHVEHIFTNSSISAFLFSQSRNSHASSLVFSIPIWLLWSFSIALDCNCASFLIDLPFIGTPSIIVSSSMNVQYGHISILCLICLKAIPLWHIFSGLAGISPSLFFVWFCFDSLSAMYRSGSGLKIMFIFPGVFSVGCTLSSVMVPKKVLFKQNPFSSVMLSEDMLVLLWSSVSCSSFSHYDAENCFHWDSSVPSIWAGNKVPHVVIMSATWHHSNLIWLKHLPWELLHLPLTSHHNNYNQKMATISAMRLFHLLPSWLKHLISMWL